MADIKVKEIKDKTIKSLNKTKVWTERVKEPIALLNNKSKEQLEENNTTSEYGEEQIKFYSNRMKNETIYQSKKVANKTTNKLKEEYKKNKVIKKSDKLNSKIVKSPTNKIKNTKNNIKKTERITNESVKTSKKILEQGRKLAIQATKSTIRTTKAAIKATISTIKLAIAGTKALISALIAGGSVALIIVVVICLIGLMCGSIFGIFFSGSKTSSNSITMTDVIAECNQEFSNKLQTIQDQNPHDDYVLDGNMASWKDILIIYTVRQSNGLNQQEVVTMDNGKKIMLKQIFWDMNQITSEVKMETVTEQGVNALEPPKQVQKKVLHIKITPKSIENMKMQYHLSSAQLQQITELSDEEYESLWRGVIYGSDNGEYTKWRQKGATWSNIKIGSTSSTIGDIGCLVTSIAILIEKSGVSTPMVPFNPGTFVEALNTKGGFDNNGNLQYMAINKVVPEFRYMGHVELRNKTREEKLSLITQYFEQGYYLVVEVKGATPGNQHWVAVNGINGNNIIIVDPATNRTDMWSAYEWGKTTQFNYFKAN